MAETTIVAGDPLAVQLYSELVYSQAIRYTTMTKLMIPGLDPTDSSNFCQFFEDTSTKSGDKIFYDIIYNIFGAGIAGDSVIAGNEKKLTFDQDVLVINQLRQSILLKGMMSQQRVPFSLRDKAKNANANWLRQMIEWGVGNQAAGNSSADTLPYIGATGADSGQYNFTGMQPATEPTSDHWFFPQGAASEGVVGTDPKYAMTLDLIPSIVAFAQGNALNPIKPVVIAGLEIAGILFLDHLQIKDLKVGFGPGEWGNIMLAAMQGGQVQGNPIFTGAIGIHENVVIHQSTYLPWGDGATTNLVKDPETKQMVPSPGSLYNGGGTNQTNYAYSTANIGRGVFVGAQALSMAVGMADGSPDNPMRVKWVEEPLDAINQLRITCGMIWGLKKTIFGGSDYGVCTISTFVSPT